MLEYYRLIKQSSNDPYFPFETQWFLDTNLEGPNVTDIVIISWEHGTLLFDDKEYTTITSMCLVDRLIVVTSKIPDTLLRLI